MVHHTVDPWDARRYFTDVKHFDDFDDFEHEEEEGMPIPMPMPKMMCTFVDGPLDKLVCNEPGSLGEPVYSGKREGQSVTRMPDGTVVKVGGYYGYAEDPDFMTYNDVWVYPRVAKKGADGDEGRKAKEEEKKTSSPRQKQKSNSTPTPSPPSLPPTATAQPTSPRSEPSPSSATCAPSPRTKPWPPAASRPSTCSSSGPGRWTSWRPRAVRAASGTTRPSTRKAGFCGFRGLWLSMNGRGRRGRCLGRMGGSRGCTLRGRRLGSWM
ncbi:hypothetical protein CC80DRAFT_487641 [Byssothecium circinans]|uniref:Uncharacterized protein n=1 Tax=Byssothecium circinans TaxID=147558 RepID=A0A6A5UB19_9PLEO|nr:hypothetical protein CC80DRAFT_487641 [Byssothecium circinans]